MRSDTIFQIEKLVRIDSYRIIVFFALCFTVQSALSSSDKRLHISRPAQVAEVQHILPVGWEKFCTYRRMRHSHLHVDCFMNRQYSGLWKFDLIKNHLAKQSAKYTFNIKCEDGAAISLYWPMKALNLRGISVENCRLDDYFSGYGKENNLPDELEYYVFRNNILVIDIKIFMSLVKNPIDQDYDCGNEDTIQYYINRNTTYDFLDNGGIKKFAKPHEAIQNSAYEIAATAKDVKLNFFALKSNNVERTQIAEVSKDFHTKISSVEYKCIFRSLKYKEDRPTDSMLTPSVKNSHFPALSIYNISHLNLLSIPDSFTKWYYHFQHLQILDVSYNGIKKFKFDALPDVWDIPVLKVNLSYNNITEIKAKQIEELVQIKKLYVDLRHNPINCSCSDITKQLITLVKDENKWKQSTYQRYKYVRDMQCYYPENLRGKRLVEIDNKDLNCKYIIVEKMMVEGIACLGTVVLILTSVLLLIVVLVCCRRSRHRFVWDVNSGKKGLANLADRADIYTIVIPEDKQANIKLPPIF